MIARVLLLISFSALALFSLSACATPPEEPTASATSAEWPSPPPPSCGDQCLWASQSCVQQCSSTPSECAEAIAICFDSCSRGVGPYLPC